MSQMFKIYQGNLIDRAVLCTAVSCVLMLMGCGGNSQVGKEDSGVTDSSYADSSLVDGSIALDAIPQNDGGEIPAAECFSVYPHELELVSVSGSYAVGAFNIMISDFGGVSVTHSDEPLRTLFKSPGESESVPRERSLLKIERTDLMVSEHQGSFEIQEEPEVICEQAHIKEVRKGEGVLVIFGGFHDEQGPCNQLEWELQVCQAAEGHLAFRVTSVDDSFNAVTLRASSVSDEMIFGMGEQFPHDTLDLKGRVIPVISQEGGVGRGHGVISPAVNSASPGSAGSETSTYYAAPHYLTSRMRSLFLEDTEYAVFDFTRDEVISMKLFSHRMTGRILYGSSPLELIQRFTDYAGRMEVLPEWVNNGAIIALARSTQESAQIVSELLGMGAEISAVWNQTWSGKVTTYIGEQVLWNWVANPSEHPQWDSFVEDMEAQNIRVLCYVNPMFVEVPPEAPPVTRHLYEEGLANDYFVRDDVGDVLKIPVTAFDVALLDLTNASAWAWMKEIIQVELIDGAGCSGWMVDFGEALPYEATLHSGVPASQFHNIYPVEWMRLNREAVEETGGLGDVLLFNRSGFTRTPAHSLLLWQGDQLTTWDKYDGLVSALHGLISSGFSGITLNHSDTGGYTSLSRWELGYTREAELLKRWTEMNAFTAVLRTHEGNQPEENAQIYSDEDAMLHFTRFTKVYKALGFYRSSLFEDARDYGWPVVRHLWMHFPDDKDGAHVHDQFLLGSEILVAPIKNKCWTPPVCPYNKQVYFPAEEWVHLWTGEIYGDSSTGVTDTVSAPIGQPAVFYRRGSPVGETFVQNLQDGGINVPDPPL